MKLHLISIQREVGASKAEEKHIQLFEFCFCLRPRRWCADIIIATMILISIDIAFTSQSYWLNRSPDVGSTDEVYAVAHRSICGRWHGCALRFWIPVLPRLLSQRFGWTPRRIISKTTLKITEGCFFRKLWFCCRLVFRNRVKNLHTVIEPLDHRGTLPCPIRAAKSGIWCSKSFEDRFARWSQAIISLVKMNQAHTSM